MSPLLSIRRAEDTVRAVGTWPPEHRQRFRSSAPKRAMWHAETSEIRSQIGERRSHRRLLEPHDLRGLDCLPAPLQRDSDRW